MYNIEHDADVAKDAIDNLYAHAQRLELDFRRIADLARNIDENNWKELSEEVFRIAYDNY